jgi:hypothetical protein
MNNTIDYKQLYFKYKSKYITLKNQLGSGPKKSKSCTTTPSPAVPTDEITKLFTDIKTLSETPNPKEFLKKYVKKIDSISGTVVNSVTPLQYYINLGGKSSQIIEFLLPCDNEKLFNLDIDGQTIFHRLAINNDADTFEYIYFMLFGEDNESNNQVRDKILSVRNGNSYTVHELLQRHVPTSVETSTHNDMINLIAMLRSSMEYSEKLAQYLTRQLQSSRAQEAGLLCHGSNKPHISDGHEVCQAEPTKKLGSRKIMLDDRKNNDTLTKRMRGDKTDKYHYCYKFEHINSWVKSGHIHFINDLYIKKSESDIVNELIGQIPPEWNVGNIRLITNTTLDDPRITMIAEMQYDYRDQGEDDDSK